MASRPRYAKPTAFDEIDLRQKYTRAMEAGGLRRMSDGESMTSFPFCRARKVFLIWYAGANPKNPRVTARVPVFIPMANHEYERAFITGLIRENSRALSEVGLTDDADANAALRMCL